MELKHINPPLLVVDVVGFTSWNDWLSETESKLIEFGYRKYKQNYKHEDFCYWKVFKDGENKIYQVGVLFYDFRKYVDRDPYSNKIGIMYECILLGEDRIDMCVSKNIDLVEFEYMAKEFYLTMKKYI